ncbi:Uncharacterised protein [Mycolicibacterium tokaiense]|uniref:Uncharacterized protein n=1 Tax=Mycolicibacterium tokaiense TaxID=39695 RepID=A0A378TBH2_9MYCO|nr:hypothetical protein MTOK_30810 [Mycolicibacterium tokaiense]STZ58188.1 Uncharacterised protein [Mycolicibacterium tokaiense]
MAEQHRRARGLTQLDKLIDRVQYARDLERSDYIAHVGWLDIRVIGTHPEARIVRRVSDACVMRGYGPGTNRRAIGNHFCRSSEVSYSESNR